MAEVIYPREGKEIISSGGETIEGSVSTVTNVAQTRNLIELAGEVSTICCYSGNITNSGITMVAETTFTAKSGFNYKPTPTVTMHNLVQGGYDYSSYYTTRVVPVYINNRITSFKAQVFYNPPQDKFLFPDPHLFSSFDHLAFVDYDLQTIEQVATDIVTHISYKAELSRFDQETTITTYGTVGAKYNIRIREFTWFQNDWVLSGNEYDFKQNTFTTISGDSIKPGTIKASGKNNHFIKIPYVTSRTRYDIVLHKAAGFELHANIPSVNGDASMIQYGLQRLDVSTASYASATAASKEDTIFLPAFIPSISTQKVNAKPIFVEAGNDNSSSTIITLEVENVNIKEGMRVFNLGAGTHGITVSKIQDRILTLSSAVALANNTELRFEESNNDLYDLTLTVYPPSGKTLYKKTGIEPTIGNVGGFSNVSVLANGAVDASATVVLDSTAGIVPGMVITGKGILDNKEIQVSSITNATTLVATSTITIADNTRLTFTGTNSGIEVIDIQAEVFDGGVKIRPTLKINEIQDVYIDGSLQTAAIGYVYVDNFIVAN